MKKVSIYSLLFALLAALSPLQIKAETQKSLLNKFVTEVKAPLALGLGILGICCLAHSGKNFMMAAIAKGQYTRVSDTMKTGGGSEWKNLDRLAELKKYLAYGTLFLALGLGTGYLTYKTIQAKS